MRHRLLSAPANFAALLRIGFCLIAILLLARIAGAQGSAEGTTPSTLTPGIPAGSYQLSGFDTVNLFNGNLNFHLPLLNVGGRGSAQIAPLLKIEERWQVLAITSCSPCGPVNYPTYNWWTGYQVGYGPGNMEARLSTWGSQQDFTGTEYPEFSLLRFTFTGPDGTEYELRDVISDGAPQPVNVNVVPGQQRFFLRGSVFATKDGTSATFVACLPDGTLLPYYDEGGNFDPTLPFGYLMLRDGTRYRIDAGLVTWMQDRNGNRINFFYNSQDPFGHPDGRVTRIVDSLNRQINIAYDVNAGAPYGVCDQLTFSGFGGAQRTIRVSKTNMSNALRSGFVIRTTRQLFPMIAGSDSGPFNPGVTSAVWLPDGRSYRFYYNDYGELARVELPTGGAMEYDWAAGAENSEPGGSLGGSIIYRRVMEKRVYANGGTGTAYESRTTFSRLVTDVVDVKEYGSGPAALTTTRHYIHGNDLPPSSLAFFSYNSWLDAKEYKTESLDSDGTTVLQRVEHTFFQQPPSWWGQADPEHAPSNNPRIIETKTTWVQTNQVSTQKFSYDIYNNKTAVEEFDYGAGAPPANPVRRTETDYVTTNELNGIDYTGSNIQTGINTRPYLRSLAKEQRTYSVSSSGVKTLAASTHFYYDQSALTDRPGITGHDALYTTSFVPRGNLTSSVIWVDTGGSVTTSQQYDIAGNVVQSTDALGNTSLIEFASSLNTYAFATVTRTPVPDTTGQQGSGARLVTQYDYDFSSGLLKSITDPNNQVTTASYNDALDRLTNVVSPAGGGQTTYQYGDVIGNLFVRTLTAQDASTTLDSSVFFDNLGRTVRTSRSEGGGSAVSVDTRYDALGRESQESNPYRAGDTLRWTVTEYDALSRVFRVTMPGGALITTAYSGNSMTVSDPAAKARTTVSDALGRVSQVTEDPGLAPHLNYQTSYTYDALNNLRKVTQGSQARYFMYDSLKRLIRTKSPEQDVNTNLPALSDPVTGNSQWSFRISYDNNGNVVSRTDPRNITTNYTYDALNRVRTRGYTGDPSQTPSVTYKYDGAGSTAQNALGKLTLMSASSTSGFASSYSNDNFDAMGRVLRSTQTTDGQPYSVNYQYDLAGHLTSETYPSGRVVTIAYDAAGRIGDLSSGATHYASAISYTAHGAVREVKLGNNLWEHTLYDPDRLQPTEIGLGAAQGGSDKLKLNYSYGAPASNNGTIQTHTITIPSGSTLTQSFTYDGVNRLMTAQESNGVTTVWKQSFTYDRFGNRSVDVANTTAGLVGPNPLISAATNRIIPRPGEQYTHDLAGNLIKDAGGHTFDYDAENKQVKYDNTVGQYFYDGNGQRVKKVDGAGTTIFVYDALGKLVAEYTTGSASGSGTSYLTQDLLSTPRVITGTNPAALVKARHDYLPFGEEINAGVGGRSAGQGYVADGVRQKYTGKERDTETGLDYFNARYYSSPMGRFTSADSVIGKVGNPQTFNLYAYVQNNPLALVDPTGNISESEYDGTAEKVEEVEKEEEQKKKEKEKQKNEQQDPPSPAEPLPWDWTDPYHMKMADMQAKSPDDLLPVGCPCKAEALQLRAKELQEMRPIGKMKPDGTQHGGARRNGTTAAVEVFNTRTRETQIWVTTQGYGIPKEWEGKERPGEVFMAGKKGQDAEMTIISKLGSDWIILSGGTSRNVCFGCAKGLSERGVQVGGPTFPGSSDKTPYRQFWRR